jgi:2'-5' RNA ligase
LSLIPPNRRLFLALWPDEGAREQLAAHASQWAWSPGCARYQPADWHVTLHFIGPVDADCVANVSTHAAVPFQPFELVLEQPALWRHGLAVLCAAKIPQPLRALYDRLGDALRELDLPVESRPYQPHLTLARHAEAATPPTASAPVLWQVRNFALVVSTGRKDTRYQVIREYC